MGIHYDQGQYMAVVTQQGFKESTNGNPVIVLKVKPYLHFQYDSSGVEIEDNLPSDSWERSIFLTVTKKTTDFVLKKLRAAGFEGSSFRELDLQGKSVRCRCSHGTDNNGADREEWDLVYEYESKPLEPLDSAAARKLDALFGRELKTPVTPVDTSKMKPSHAAAVHAQQPPEQDAAMATEEDVPF
jgi:hypothetical protein